MKIPDELALSVSLTETILSTFLREEIRRIGMTKAVFGLSGGIDSALVCYLVTKALGPENTIPVMMPSAQSSADSLEDARACMDALKIPRHYNISVSPQVETYYEKSEVPTSSDEMMMKNRMGNKYARERMTILYDLSAYENALVIGTSNKTELLLGYGTLHGDMASAINPIGDLYKMQVYQLSEALGVPACIMKKPPTADLWAGQTDEDQLGFSYYDVDRLLFCMVDRRFSDQDLIENGFDSVFIKRVRTLIRTSQFKRRLPVIAKISERTINRDFNYARDWGT